MSDRYLTLPGSAMEQGLSYIAKTLDRIDRRTRWAGAVHATHPAGVSITYGTMVSPATTTIASLTLDPGRWLVLGGSWIVQYIPGSVSLVTMSLTGIAGQPATEQAFMDTLFNPGVDLAVAGTQILTDQTTVELKVSWGLDTPSGYETSTSSDTYLIAMPA